MYIYRNVLELRLIKHGHWVHRDHVQNYVDGVWTLYSNGKPVESWHMSAGTANFELVVCNVLWA